MLGGKHHASSIYVCHAPADTLALLLPRYSFILAVYRLLRPLHKHRSLLTSSRIWNHSLSGKGVKIRVKDLHNSMESLNKAIHGKLTLIQHTFFSTRGMDSHRRVVRCSA